MDFFRDIVMVAATTPAASAAAVELFPDPTLADVADGTNGWSFADSGTMGPLGGTGPGIALVGANEDSSAILVGADATAFEGALSPNTDYTFAITVAAFSAGSIEINLGGGFVMFAPAGNGLLSHTLNSGVAPSFSVRGADPATFDMTAMSCVTA